PHPGHCLTRAIKDLFPRYKTMRGYRCERKAGWDTHGLPVETEVSKDLGIHSKEEIEQYGIEPFIHRCQASVWRYMQEWQNLTERIGFWVDLENAYVTYHQSYVESVWWSLKQLFDRGLLYKGHKIVWWWAQGGTALSSGEVAQGYRQVADPSVYVKFPLLDDDGNDSETSLLVWTTTPWTLPSNHYVAVNPRMHYIEVRDPSDVTRRFVVAVNLLKTIEVKLKESLHTVGDPFLGRELLNRRYRPPFSEFFNQHGERVGALKRDRVTDYFRDYVASSEELDKGRLRILAESWYPHKQRPLGWVVVAAPFVTSDSGTGLVHIAPAFGDDDNKILKREREFFRQKAAYPPLLCAVASNGGFTDDGPDYCRGRWVKDCDKDIIRDLKQRGLVLHQEQYVHDYPFCWRAENDPLIQYPRESWFIRTTDYRARMYFNNLQISWMPEHIRDGRMGNFLASNVDWALSRERYWGTPLPIWECSETGKREAIGSYSELLSKPGVTGAEAWATAKEENPELVDDLKVHKPYIDEITYDSPFAAGARMRRVPEVIDCWYDSGAMPFAQWGYPAQPNSKERFAKQFPADFISEAIDQTRGWFYSQLAISTLLFGPPLSEHEAGKLPLDLSELEALRRVATRNPERAAEESSLATYSYPHPFRNCIVLGLMLGEDGQKMSKSKRNYREPAEIFDRYGADALRWYFFANQPPWTSIRYSEQAIKDSVPEFLLRLWNVYSFFTIYANIDGFNPAEEVGRRESGATGHEPARVGERSLSAGALAAAAYRPLAQRAELDRWITSELHRTAARVVERMDQYDNFAACAAITEFVDALSNWYVRRSRDRFWAPDKRSPDKLDAYWTLYECLVATAKLIAPFTPFLAESLWRNLAADEGVFGDCVVESVHLADYPTGDPAAIDEQLSERMNLVRHIASLGRQARTAANLKVRQPLARVEVILADASHQAWLQEHAAVIADELNVKQVEFSDEPDKYVTHEVLPNFKLLGPKLGKLLPKVKQWLAGQ
ncbi:MAG TPA: class I tRNA ligase family protein, partial [Lacipirellulaceae bacterium]|nr:class I tRNA ligase family protein [Lacipirellulaceae bacterium]